MPRIYQASWYHGDEGCQLSWHSSKRKAQAAVAQAKREARKRLRHVGAEEPILDCAEPTAVQAYDIPTTKAGLLRWLNAHFTTDNGGGTARPPD